MIQDRVFKLKEHVLELSERAGVEVHFLKTRRATDLARFVIFGEKAQVLSLPLVFEDLFQDQAIEIINAMYHSQDYSLTMVITERLEAHPVFSPERRIKLLRLQQDNDTNMV